jgi:hypothetical protein
MVGVDIAFETFNEIGYLFKSFFYRKSPLAPPFLRGVKLTLRPHGEEGLLPL